MVDLKLNFVAPGEFGGVKAFPADDGTVRRMWTINYLGGKINGFLGSSAADDELFQYLERVPFGTAARAFGVVDVSGGDDIKLSAQSFAVEGTEGFPPLETAEILAGCTFSGLLICWRKEERRDGSLDVRFAGMGTNFNVRDVSPDLFAKLNESGAYKVAGLLETSLVFKGSSRVPVVGVRVRLQQVKPVSLMKKE